jgi:hypothetical protein
MKIHYLILLAPLLLTACGPGALPMQKSVIEDKKVTYELLIPSTTFYEKTFGNSMAHAMANSLVAPALQNHNEPLSATEMPQQSQVEKYMPITLIEKGLKERLKDELGWQEVKTNADYKVDVVHSGWGIRHHPLKVSTYSIYYTAALRIAETSPAAGKDKVRSASFFCQYASDSDYYYDEVYANGAAAVLKVTDAATPYCIDNIMKQIHEKMDAASGKTN